MKRVDLTIAERWATLYFYRRILRLGNWDEHGRGKAWQAITDDAAFFDFTFAFFPNLGPWTVEENRKGLSPAEAKNYYGSISALHPMYLNGLGPIHDYIMRNFSSIRQDVAIWLGRNK